MATRPSYARAPRRSPGLALAALLGLVLLLPALLGACSDDASGGPTSDTGDTSGDGDVTSDAADTDGGRDISSDPDLVSDTADESDLADGGDAADTDGGTDATDTADDAADSDGDAAPDPCAVMDATATGSCDTFVGWAWDGDLCVRLNGCACSGADCGRLYTSRRLCEEATAACFFDALSYQFVMISPLEDQAFSMPLDLNGDGRLVGSSGREPFSNDATAAFVDVPGTLQALDVPEASFGYARAVNAAGVIVGENQMLPQYWEDGVRTGLTVPEGYGSGVARDIDDNGLIIGTYADYDDALPPSPIGGRPCYWTSESAAPVPMTTLGAELPLGTPVAINASGQVAGTLTNETTTVAGLWPSVFGAPAPLRLADDAVGAEAYGMNDYADVVGRTVFEDNHSEAFLYRRESASTVALPFPVGVVGTPYGEAYDVNAAGAVVGSASSAGGGLRAVMWYGGEVIELISKVTPRPEGVRYLFSAHVIDDRGRIALEVVLSGDEPDTPRTIGLLVPRER